MKKSDQVMGIFIRKRKWVYVSKSAGDEYVSWRFLHKNPGSTIRHLGMYPLAN
jgi:hypothetical protein